MDRPLLRRKSYLWCPLPRVSKRCEGEILGDGEGEGLIFQRKDAFFCRGRMLSLGKVMRTVPGHEGGGRVTIRTFCEKFAWSGRGTWEGVTG